MLDYMLMPFRRYADFSGRSRRMEFWSFALLNIIVMAVITGIVLATSGSFAAFTDSGNGMMSAYSSLLFGSAGMLYAIWWLATIVPNVAVTVRRFHDRDMSGWWYLGVVVLSMIPLIGMLVGLAFLVLMLLPGTPGANRFGLDPKDPSGTEVFA